MGRNLSPVLRRELENLDKDPDSRKLAMKALKTYVKDLDAKAIPLFLSQVSERKEPGSSSGEYTISLYEVLARVHGRNIVPQIENIMSTIIRTLSSSAGSFPLHQACAKVVPAIARYGIDPSTPDDEKMRIIGSLCKPLADVLMSPIESATSGAALCLKALVESDNWRFASNDAANDVCLKVAGALEEKHTQTNAHMSLAMALSKHNALIAEAYARSLVRSGLQILTTGAKECNSQKRMSAIQMINFLMKHTDSRSISSELDKVVVVMEKCRGDRMPFVGSAALDALQTAKMITGQKGSEHEISLSPVVGSNFDRDGRSLSLDDGDYVSNIKSNGFPAEFASPESRTVESLLEHDASVDSPMSVGQASSNFEYARRATRRLWNNDSWGVDVSLRDGLFRKDGTGCEVSKFYLEQFRNGDLSESHEDHSETFSGFPQATVDAMSSNSLSSPQRSRPQLTVDDVKIYSTPRKLIRSLQNSTTANSEGHDHQQSRTPATPTSGEVAWNPARVTNGSTNSQVSNYEVNERKNRHDVSLLKNTRISHDSDSVTDCSRTASSASAAHTEHACNGSCGLDSGYKNGTHEVSMKKNGKSKAFIGFFCFIFLILLAIFSSAIWMGNSEALHDAVPT